MYQYVQTYRIQFFDYLKFSAVMFKSMYHLATSRVCVLDSYWPPVSLLKHKEELRVIQIWHAIGKIKQSGLQSVGKKSGRKAEYADFLICIKIMIISSQVQNRGINFTASLLELLKTRYSITGCRE